MVLHAVFDFDQALKDRKLTQRLLGCWFYEALHTHIRAVANLHLSEENPPPVFTGEGLYHVLVRILRNADMISDEMVGPMFIQRAKHKVLTRIDYVLNALERVGDIESVGRIRGSWRITAKGLSQLFKFDDHPHGRDERLAYAKHIREMYDAWAQGH